LTNGKSIAKLGFCFPYMIRPCGQVLFLKYAKLGLFWGALGTIEEVDQLSPTPSPAPGKKKENKNKQRTQVTC